MSSPTTTILTTSLHASHVALGARMVGFAGWEMPVSYPVGTVGEVKACRSGAGLFDVSHMGELDVSGDDAEAFLQHITTNDVSRLADGAAQYSMLLAEDGGVIDDIIVYKRAPSDYMVVVNAGCHDKDHAWIVARVRDFAAARVSDISRQTALIAVQGPTAVALVQRLSDDPALSDLPRFGFRNAAVEGVPCLVSRTGYTGEDGFELFAPWSEAPYLWNALILAGAVPCGLGARDVLRLEAAYPLYGHELSESHTPLESGTGWATKLAKPEFVGRSAVARQKRDGVPAKLVGLKMLSPANAIPRDGYDVLAGDGSALVGSVTSGTLSPMAGSGIAMARVRGEAGRVGARLQVDIRGRRAECEVVALPFYRNGV